MVAQGQFLVLCLDVFHSVKRFQLHKRVSFLQSTRLLLLFRLLFPLFFLLLAVSSPAATPAVEVPVLQRLWPQSRLEDAHEKLNQLDQQQIQHYREIRLIVAICARILTPSSPMGMSNLLSREE